MRDETAAVAEPPQVDGPSLNQRSSNRRPWWNHLALLDNLDVRAILCQRFSPMRNIPKRCLSALCDIMDATMEGIANPDVDIARRCSRLWLLLPRMLLGAVFSERKQVVARGGDMRRIVTERLRRFQAGQWVDLLHDAPTQQRTAVRTTTHPSDEDEEAEEQRLCQSAREAVRLCRLNELSRAMTRLTSTGIAAPSRKVAEMLRKEIAGETPLADEPPGIGFDWRNADLPRARVDPTMLKRRLRESPRGASPSVSGWRFEFLKLFLRSERSFQHLHTVAEMIANAEAPADLIQGLCLNPLTAKKKGERVRPLAAPDTLRRLVAGTLCASRKEDFREDLSPEQHAGGIPAGAEVLAKAAQVHVERTGFSITEVDGTSAFNRQIRRIAFA